MIPPFRIRREPERHTKTAFTNKHCLLWWAFLFWFFQTFAVAHSETFMSTNDHVSTISLLCTRPVKSTRAGSFEKGVQGVVGGAQDDIAKEILTPCFEKGKCRCRMFSMLCPRGKSILLSGPLTKRKTRRSVLLKCFRRRLCPRVQQPRIFRHF